MGGRGHGKVRKRTTDKKPTRLTTSTAIARRAKPDLIPLDKIGDIKAASMSQRGLARSHWTTTQAAAVVEPFEPEELDILPGGEVYVPQIQVRKRLNRIFGPGQWGVELGEPQEKGGRVIVRTELVVNGASVAAAYGEGALRGGRKATWGRAIETAKSNGLVRCIKDIGMAADCWDRRWTASFREQHGVYVKFLDREGNEDVGWRNVLAPPMETEVDIDPRSPNQDRYTKPSAAKRLAAKSQPRRRRDDDAAEASELRHQTSVAVRGDKQISRGALQRLIRIAKEHQRTDKALKAWIRNHFGHTSKKQILESQYDAVIEWCRAPGKVDEETGERVDASTGEVVEAEVLPAESDDVVV